MTDSEPMTAKETEVLEVPTIESPTEEAATDAAHPRPHIRWGAFVWGLIVIATVAWTLSIIGSPDARESFMHWFTGLTAGGWIIVGVFAIGGIILVRGLVALLKLTQKPRD